MSIREEEKENIFTELECSEDTSKSLESAEISSM